MNLRGNTILITGGTGGIGRALAQRLSGEGNAVIVCGRREDRLAALHETHPGIVTRRCDLARPEERHGLADWIVREHPDLNVLVNNAGVQLRFDATRPVDLARIALETELNIVAPVHLTSLLAGHLATRPGATVVNVSSGLAFAPLARVGFYSATKAAVHSITLTMRHQLARLGIRVIELGPPSVDTELGGDLRDDPAQTHGGMPIADFVEAAMAALASESEEILVGLAARMKAEPEDMFRILNNDAGRVSTGKASGSPGDAG